MAKKQSWEHFNEQEQKKVAKQVTKAIKVDKPAKGKEKVKMVRIGEEEHAMLKKLAPWKDMSMQELIDMLVRNAYNDAFSGKK